MGVISLLTLLSSTLLSGQQRNRPQAQKPLEEGTSTIAGRVVDSQSKEPLAGVEITLSMFITGPYSGGGSPGGVVTTDARGRYTFPDIGEGTYLVMARKPEYLNACYLNPEATTPCGMINVLRDQKRLDVDFPLVKGATARGRVVDHAGAPVVGATVRMGSPQQPRNEIARTILFMNSSAESAKDGTFELRGIPPGEWNLELELKPQPGSMRLPVFFYPGVMKDDEAKRVEFSAGSITDNLLFTIPGVAEHALTVRVSPGPLPIGDIRASLLQMVPFIVRGIGFNDDGIGQITGLLEGRYFIAARGWIKDKAWAAFEIVDFIPPTLDLSLQLMPAGRIAGRIVAQNGGLPPLSGVSVATPWVQDDVEINPVTPDQSPVAADGSFQVEGLFGRRAVQVTGLDAGWQVASIMLGRSEITSVDVPPDTTIEVTIIVARVK